MYQVRSLSLFMLLLAGCADDSAPIAVAELEGYVAGAGGRGELHAPWRDEPGYMPYFLTRHVEVPNGTFKHAFYDAESCDVVTRDTPLSIDLSWFQRSDNVQYGLPEEYAQRTIGKIYVVREADDPTAWVACGPLVAQ